MIANSPGAVAIAVAGAITPSMRATLAEVSPIFFVRSRSMQKS
jgi:hypothetical protein